MLNSLFSSINISKCKQNVIENYVTWRGLNEYYVNTEPSMYLCVSYVLSKAKLIAG